MSVDLLKVAQAADERINAVHAAFGAPGDWGYGRALFELYKVQVELRAAIRQALLDQARGASA